MQQKLRSIRLADIYTTQGNTGVFPFLHRKLGYIIYIHYSHPMYLNFMK